MSGVQLPSDWLSCSLEEVVEIHNKLRKPVNAAERSKRVGPYPYYGATGQVGWIDDFRQDGEYVLLGEDGAPFLDITKDKAYIISEKCWVNNHAHVLKGRDGVCLNKYLLHSLNQTDFRGFVNGTTRLKLTQASLRRIPVNLAPIEEQKRIVSKIEELFSELDSGVASLKTAREQLKIYRQALLKHAFEGKLTAQWRKDNADKLETPKQLLARIQTERETRYQQQLDEWKQAVKDWEEKSKEGKKPSKPKAFEKNGEVDNNSALNLEIPEDWKLMLVGHVFSVFVGATPSRKKPNFWDGDIRWVSSGEVAFCNIHQTKEKISQEGYENTSTEIHPKGTVLLAMIGEGKTRGQAAILRIPAAHNQNTAAIRVSEIGLPAEYIYYFLQYQYEQTRKAGSGNNQKALNKSRVSNIVFPLCSVAEQKEIVNQLEEKLSIIEQNEKEIENALTKAGLLRQSILKKAFSGLLI